MDGRHGVRCGLALALVLLASPGVMTAQDYAIVSNFDSDIPGAPPATGGSNQPTAVFGAGVLVQTSANGLATQPLEVDDGSCNPGYYGGVHYNLPVAVSRGELHIKATVAANQLTDGVFFDTAVSFGGAAIARLAITNSGTIVDHFGTTLSTYAPNTPLRFRAVLDMTGMTWACTIDDELNGFGDDPVFSGLPFVNLPSVIPEVDDVILAIFGSFSACAGSRIVAFDDVLIEGWLPVFVDGFESGDTSRWSAPAP